MDDRKRGGKAGIEFNRPVGGGPSAVFPLPQTKHRGPLTSYPITLIFRQIAADLNCQKMSCVSGADSCPSTERPSVPQAGIWSPAGSMSVIAIYRQVAQWHAWMKK